MELSSPSLEPILSFQSIVMSVPSSLVWSGGSTFYSRLWTDVQSRLYCCKTSPNTRLKHPHNANTRLTVPHSIAWSEMSIFTEKASFQMKPISISEAMWISKIVAFGAQKIQTSSLRSRCTHNEWLFGADFGTVASLGHFSSKMRKEPPSWSVASVTVQCWTNFWKQKLKKITSTTLGINRMGPLATQPT